MNLLIASGNATPAAEFNVYVSPTSYFNQVNKGAFTTPTFRTSIANSVGEVSYLWSVENQAGNGTVEILNPTDESTKLTVSSVGPEVTFVLKCTATDDNGSDSSNAFVSLFFGDIL